MIYGSDRSGSPSTSARWRTRSWAPREGGHVPLHPARDASGFATEVAGVQDLGVTGRGGMAEIGTYVSKLLTSELSATSSTCAPLGAHLQALRVHRALGSSSSRRVSTDGRLEATSRGHARHGGDAHRAATARGVNEEWISDKARFSYDGRRQRLDPHGEGCDGKLKPRLGYDPPIPECPRRFSPRAWISRARPSLGASLGPRRPATRGRDEAPAVTSHAISNQSSSSPILRSARAEDPTRFFSSSSRLSSERSPRRAAPSLRSRELD